jgi:replicative DNA helicase
MVDYIQLVQNHIKGEARHIEVSGISRALKRLAMDSNIPLVALSQLNKDNEQRHNKKIYLSDLRESEAIGHDADAVIFVNRPSLYGDDGPDFLELAKNRHGERVSKIPVKWDLKYNRYEEIN